MSREEFKRVEDDHVMNWLRVGHRIKVIIEETGTPNIRTVFESCRVTAIAEESRIEEGVAVTVQVSPGQAKAFEAMKEVGKIRLEPMEADRNYYRKIETKKG
ncbi:MAG: hypothetical protein EBV06_11195 [Planctomycetia bacterium]|nr:hypothetical protein [Planctomycetia bacterium]